MTARRPTPRGVARWIGKAIAAYVLWTVVGMWVAFWLPDWANVVLQGLVVVVVATVPWPRWSEVRARRPPRWVVALVPPILGFATTVASDYWFGHHNVYVHDFGPRVLGAGADAFISLPFWLISTFYLLRLYSTGAAAFATLALGALTVLAFDSVASSTSSTAVIGYFATWITGIPFLLFAVVVDRVIDGARAGWTVWRASRG